MAASNQIPLIEKIVPPVSPAKKLKRYYPAPPRFWENFTVKSLHSHAHKRDLQLLLDARAIPYFLTRCGHREYIFIPAFLSLFAQQELAAYARENSRRPEKTISWPLYEHWQLAPLYLLPIIWMHGYISGWWPGLAWLPNPQDCLALGKLDNLRIMIHGEWWRPVTALTLHAGIIHLAGNVFFAAVFLSLLGRLCGWGSAMLLALCGGILGNLASAFIHAPGYASIGFSTALFAVIGAIAGIRIMQVSRRIFAPLAAAAALLAMLGTEGAQTDYGAHICGLIGGAVCGTGVGMLIRKKIPFLPQMLSAMLALAIPGVSWFFALR